VILDIGGDVGAAIVYTAAALAGTEIEIRREGEAWTGRHVAVRARHVPAGTVHAAVFEALRRGRYDVRLRGSHPGKPAPSPCAVQVDGGRVTEVHFLS
jgi:hypothetical protein